MKRIPFSALIPFIVLICLLGFTYPLPAQTIKKVDCFLEKCDELKDLRGIEFGYLELPEDHTFGDGRQLKIAFAVLRARGARPFHDPVLYLSGGPGIGALQDLYKWEDHFLREDRDIVLVDFRGIGYSGPEMCPELNDYLWSLFAGNYVSPEEEKQTKLRWFQDCFDELRARGLDLEQYRSAAVVQDLEILRQALGYEQWNILSVSYGTRMAQTYLRDAPEHLRSMILDSTFPVGYFMDHPLQGYLQSLTNLFQRCENDVHCNARFPQIQPWFYQVMDSLKEQPIILHPPALGKEPFTVNLQDAHLMIFQFLKNHSNYPALPYVFEAIAERNTEVFDNMITLAKGQNDRVSMAAGILINKNDNYAPPVNTATDKDPLKYALNHFDGEYEVLRTMDEFITYDSMERQPVYGEVPTLILAGGLDPATPAVYGEAVHQGLANSQYLLFQGLGHGVSRAGGCVPLLINSFLADPDQSVPNDCPEEWTADSIPFTGNLYKNSRIGTLMRQLVVERSWPLWLLLLSILIGWVISGLELWRRRQGQLSVLKGFHLSLFGTYSLAVTLITGTAILVYQTSRVSPLLVLMGLTAAARVFYYCSFLFLIAAGYTCWFGLRPRPVPQQIFPKIFYGFSVFILGGFAVFLIIYDLFPN